MKCSICGVSVTESASGRWVHTDALPARVEYHEVVPVTESTASANAAKLQQEESRREALAFAEEARARMQDPLMVGVQWTPTMKHIVTLLEMIEDAKS